MPDPNRSPVKTSDQMTSPCKNCCLIFVNTKKRAREANKRNQSVEYLSLESDTSKRAGLGKESAERIRSRENEEIEWRARDPESGRFGGM